MISKDLKCLPPVTSFPQQHKNPDNGPLTITLYYDLTTELTPFLNQKSIKIRSAHLIVHSYALLNSPPLTFISLSLLKERDQQVCSIACSFIVMLSFTHMCSICKSFYSYEQASNAFFLIIDTMLQNCGNLNKIQRWLTRCRNKSHFGCKCRRDGYYCYQMFDFGQQASTQLSVAKTC